MSNYFSFSIFLKPVSNTNGLSLIWKNSVLVKKKNVQPQFAFVSILWPKCVQQLRAGMITRRITIVTKRVGTTTLLNSNLSGNASYDSPSSSSSSSLSTQFTTNDYYYYYGRVKSKVSSWLFRFLLSPVSLLFL
jgi:hypothetical protein